MFIAWCFPEVEKESFTVLRPKFGHRDMSPRWIVYFWQGMALEENFIFSLSSLGLKEIKIQLYYGKQAMATIMNLS